MDTNRGQQQNDRARGQNQEEKNETLKNADTVPDYGRSGQQKQEQASTDQHVKPIPLDDDETIGNP